MTRISSNSLRCTNSTRRRPDRPPSCPVLGTWLPRQLVSARQVLTDAVEKGKINRPKFLPVYPSKPIFRNPQLHREFTNAPGWKSDRLFGPLHHFRTTAPVPLKKCVRRPEKPFSTVSTQPDHGLPAIDTKHGERSLAHHTRLRATSRHS
jgi:hypothetical protein